MDKINYEIPSMLSPKIINFLAHYNFEENIMRNCVHSTVSFAHVYKVMQLLENEGLIVMKMHGREKLATPTEKGIEVIKIIKDLRDRLNTK